MSDITRVLASDEFQGRAPGTAGEAKTIPYLIAAVQGGGLEPAGENGGWTQNGADDRDAAEDAVRLSVSQAGQTLPLRFPDDVYLGTVRPVDRVAIANAPMVFVGYGVTAPERGWDDFKGVDLHGKVAVMLVNDPDFEAAAGEPVAGKFGGKTMTYYGRWTYKYEEAARRGAIAALVVHETDAAGYGWNVGQEPGRRELQYRRAAGRPQPVLLQGWIQQPVAAALLKRAGYDYDSVKREARTAAFRPIGLKATFTADIPVALSHDHQPQCARQADRFDPSRTRSSAMAATGTPGSGLPTRRADDPAGRRRRCPRACGMLEDARLFAAGPRPQRTLLFAAWTGEERGLLGSEYYRPAPAVPDGQDGRQPDVRHAAVERAGQGRGAGRQGAERDGGSISPRPPRRRGAMSPTRTTPSAACSTAPTISPSRSAGFRCLSIWRWPERTTWSTAAGRRARSG